MVQVTTRAECRVSRLLIVPMCDSSRYTAIPGTRTSYLIYKFPSLSVVAFRFRPTCFPILICSYPCVRPCFHVFNLRCLFLVYLALRKLISRVYVPASVKLNRLLLSGLVLKGANPTGLHSMDFRNFAMVLSDSQLELLALTLNINETNSTALAHQFREEFPDRMNVFMSHVMREPLGRNSALDLQPCAWNMLLSRR